MCKLHWNLKADMNVPQKAAALLGFMLVRRNEGFMCIYFKPCFLLF
jgi:hypothetical protein